MPTGYTSIIENGATFKEFAKECASAFLIECRESRDKIPLNKKVDQYHKKELIKAEKNLKDFKSLTKKGMQEVVKKEILRRRRSNNRYEQNRVELKKKYEEILVKAKSWKPPRGHTNLKKFMLEQLESSIRFDCSEDTWERPEYTLKEHLKSLRWDVKHHKESYKRDVKNNEWRNKWVGELYGSL